MKRKPYWQLFHLPRNREQYTSSTIANLDRSHVDDRPHDTAPWFVTVCWLWTFVCLVGTGSRMHVFLNLLASNRIRIIRILNEWQIYLGFGRWFVARFLYESIFLVLTVLFTCEWINKTNPVAHITDFMTLATCLVYLPGINSSDHLHICAQVYNHG